MAEILRIAYDDLPAPEAAELSRLLTSASLFQRFEPVTGAYDALVSSGHLGLLRSQELRSELAAVFGAVGKGYEDEAMADALHVQWTLMSVRRGPLLGMMTPEILSIIGYSGARPPIDFHALLGDEEYLGLIAAVGVLEGLHLRYFHNLDTRVTGILKLLAQELTK